MKCSVCGIDGDTVYSVHSKDGTALIRYCLSCASDRIAVLEKKCKDEGK